MAAYDVEDRIDLLNGLRSCSGRLVSSRRCCIHRATISFLLIPIATSSPAVSSTANQRTSLGQHGARYTLFDEPELERRMNAH
jgi:hypothetical protein